MKLKIQTDAQVLIAYHWRKWDARKYAKKAKNRSPTKGSLLNRNKALTQPPRLTRAEKLKSRWQKTVATGKAPKVGNTLEMLGAAISEKMQAAKL